MLVKNPLNNDMLVLSDDWRHLGGGIAPRDTTWSWTSIIQDESNNAVFIGRTRESEEYFIGAFPESIPEREFSASGESLEIAWAEYRLVNSDPTIQVA